MENIILAIKDPEFLLFIQTVGAGILVFNLIRFFIVASKNRQAKIYLEQTANSFEGMSTGLIFVSFSSFLSGSWFLGIVSIVSAWLTFCREYRLRMISRDNDALQKVQDMLNKKDKT